MIKPILIPGAAFLATLAFGADVTITQAFDPNLIDPGGSFTVTLSVSKGDMEYKGHITQILPEGFSATALETNGAEFTFESRIVKFDWNNLPVAPEFTVSYTITVNKTTEGAFSISGRLVYREDNNNIVVNIPTERVVVGKKYLGGTKITFVGEGDEKSSRTVTMDAPSGEGRTGAVSAADIREADDTEDADEEEDADAPPPVVAAKEEKKAEPAADVVYRLQIVADTKPIDIEKYKKKNKLDEEIYEIRDRAKYIYAIGEFSDYKEVNEFKKEMIGKKGVKMPLVIGDQGGTYLSASKAKKIIGH